jgi:hypothetical protein
MCRCGQSLSLRSHFPGRGEGGWREHAEAAVWPQRVVLDDPALDDDAGLEQLSNSSPFRSSSRIEPLKRSTNGCRARKS